MTVKELIEKLQEFPEDFTVVLAGDEEGNSFQEAYEFGVGVWDSEEREYSSWTFENGEDFGPERQVTIEESNAVVIWP